MVAQDSTAVFHADKAAMSLTFAHLVFKGLLIRPIEIKSTFTNELYDPNTSIYAQKLPKFDRIVNQPKNASESSSTSATHILHAIYLKRVWTFTCHQGHTFKKMKTKTYKRQHYQI